MREQWLTFVSNHPTLVTIWGIIGIMLIVNEIKLRLHGTQKITVSDTVKLVNDEDALIVDIRAPEVFAKGHITNAVNIVANELSRDNKIIAAHKDKPIVIVCNLGNSAVPAAQKLQQQQLKKVFVLAGGMQAWQDDKMPVVK